MRSKGVIYYIEKYFLILIKDKQYLKWFVCLIMCLYFNNIQAQDSHIIYGKVTDQNGNPVDFVSVAVEGTSIGTVTDESGNYRLKIPLSDSVKVLVSCMGYKKINKKINTKRGKTSRIDIKLETDYKQLDAVSVESDEERSSTLTRISSKDIELLPSASGSIETAIATQPGVSTRSELSSQYSVRGGNFDENLIYINDIRVYRPFLIRSGQQEGLSVINPDLVSDIKFSAGGFDASYGDKLSSVLDITYKEPTDYRGSLSASLLGGRVHFEGASGNKRLTHITGFRYKTTEYLLSTMDVTGEYEPQFMDLQTYITYDITDKLEMSILGNYAQNKYRFVPKELEQAFGTRNNVMELEIYYDGSELDKFTTYLGALSFDYRPDKNLSLQLINSGYSTKEEETFDIQGQYLINQVDQSLDQYASDSTLNIGIGTFLNHARNYLDVYVFSSTHKGKYKFEDDVLEWGFKYQKEIINDDIHEWEMLDSAGYSLPYSDSEVNLYRSVVAENTIQSDRYKAYIQNTYSFDFNGRSVTLNTGIRSSYWSFNKEFIFLPRLTVSYKPLWERDVLFRFSTGYYYQPPFYKEMRFPDGSINKDIQSQKSIHYVLGSDYNLTLWDRPFKFISEIYYKSLFDLIPYKIDNVRVRYSAENNATGYATGLDLKLNGEFVEGVESWASLSFMKTMEDIKGDYYYDEQGNRVEPGYYPRPTDQLLNMSLFFQDYLPGNPTYKMQVTLLYGTPLPYSPPHSDRYDLYFRMPSYKRVDIGLSKILINRDYLPGGNAFSGIKKLWIGLEIFNLFNNVNTISYLWVNTISSDERIPDMFAVPNHLTGRRLNVKLTMKF